MTVENLWDSGWGKGVAIGLFAVATALAIAGCFVPGLTPFTFIYVDAVFSTALALGIGAGIAGYQSENLGKGFANGFANYINDEWAQSVAIGMTLALVAFGVSRALQTGKLANKCNPECFAKGTLIKTADGDKPIEEIKEGDLVYAENPETGEKGLKKVVQIFRNETKEWIHINVSNNTASMDNPNKKDEIVCTPEHPFYILNADENTPLVRFEGQEGKGTNGSWVASKDLKPGMQVLLANGNRGTINSVEVEHLETPETTYNFEVEDYHTYYVSEQGVLVHNTCFKRLDEKAFMKDNKMTSQEFHQYKADLIKESGINTKLYGKNPDIWVHKDTFRIAFKSTMPGGPRDLIVTDIFETIYKVRW